MRQNAAPRSVFSPAMLMVSLALACCLLLASGMVVPEPVMAQGEGRGPDGEDLTLLDFTKISVTKNEENGRYVITIIASAPKIPVGTKIDLLLTWRSQLVQTFYRDPASESETP